MPLVVNKETNDWLASCLLIVLFSHVFLVLMSTMWHDTKRNGSVYSSTSYSVIGEMVANWSTVALLAKSADVFDTDLLTSDCAKRVESEWSPFGRRASQPPAMPAPTMTELAYATLCLRSGLQPFLFSSLLFSLSLYTALDAQQWARAAPLSARGAKIHQLLCIPSPAFLPHTLDTFWAPLCGLLPVLTFESDSTNPTLTLFAHYLFLENSTSTIAGPRHCPLHFKLHWNSNLSCCCSETFYWFSPLARE